MLSLIATISSDSQYPFSLNAFARIRFFGRSAPSILMKRVTAEVPLRCIPRTSIAHRDDFDIRGTDAADIRCFARPARFLFRIALIGVFGISKYRLDWTRIKHQEINPFRNSLISREVAFKWIHGCARASKRYLNWPPSRAAANQLLLHHATAHPTRSKFDRHLPTRRP